MLTMQIPNHTFVIRLQLLKALRYKNKNEIKCTTAVLLITSKQQKQTLCSLRTFISQILMAGMQIEGEEHALLIPDEELASLRSVEKLEVICEDILPKKLSDIRRLTAELAQRRQPLSWQDFERTVLTLVYTTQTLARISNQQQREVWTDAVIKLFRAVQKDLKPT